MKVPVPTVVATRKDDARHSTIRPLIHQPMRLRESHASQAQLRAQTDPARQLLPRTCTIHQHELMIRPLVTVPKSVFFTTAFSANLRSNSKYLFRKLPKIMLRISTFHRLARLSSVSALLLCPIVTFAQAPAARIRGPIETSPSVPLEGSLNPHVRISQDLGPLAPDTPIRGVTLVFKRSTAQEAALQQLLTAQTNPSSPLFHHWLTPEDFAARFGVADADIAATESWLQSHGLTLDKISPSPSSHPDRITFSGTAAQIQQAFSAELHHYRTGSGADAELHFAPATELSLPPTLAPLTAAVLHLSDFRPKPSVRTIRPDFTTAANQTHFLSPADLQIMYRMKPYSAYTSGSLGAGQSIAVVGQSYVPTGTGSAEYNFATILTGNYNVFPVFVPGSGNEAAIPGDEGEADIDIEYSSGTASGASVFYVFTGSNPNYNVFDALDFAITQGIAPVISISYGGCEPLMSTSDLLQANSLFEQAAAQGQTIIASSGDSGPTACAAYSTADGVSVTQQQALAVSFPASSPYVTAVGGTQMAPGTFTAGASTYWSSAGATDNIQSLLTYIPEVTWNESSSTYGIAASGGGVSSVFPRPAWQTGVPGIPSGNYRLVPDIALQASIASPGFIICSDDQALSGANSDCLSNTLQNSNNRYVVGGGTSFAAPIFAGFIAILNQTKQTLGQGSVNPILYGLAAQPSVYASAFHDITSGTTACAAGDGNCGTPGESVYAANTGYDMATGLGSIDLNDLFLAWPSTSASGLGATNTLFNSTPLTAVAGQIIPLQIVVNPLNASQSATVPTGSLAISLDGQILNAAVPFATSNIQSAQAGLTYSITTPSQTGTHIVIARYSGDSTHYPSVSTWPITVGNLQATGTVAISAANLSIPSNGSGTTQISITPSGGYSGELTWTATLTGGSGTAQTLCYIVNSPLINAPTTATLSIGAGTACSGPLPTGSMAPTRVQSFVQRASAQPRPLPSRGAPAAATFAALLLGFTLSSRRRRRLLPTLCTFILAALTLTGCGGGSSGGTTGGGSQSSPTPQYYTLTLKAQDSVNTSITSTTTFTLTVN
jgi:subtilase family serine protease